MTANRYNKYGVNLSIGQRRNLAKAIQNRSAVSLKLKKDELIGNDELYLTKTQIAKIVRAKNSNKGVLLKISKTQVRNVVKHGSSLFSSLMKIGTKILPTMTKILPGVATGALSALTDLGLSKALSGGYMVKPDRFKDLIPYKGLLTEKQIKDMIKANKNKKPLVINPTRAQKGGFLGSLLATIGIPLLVQALTGKGQRPRIRPYGYGMQNRPYGRGMRNQPYNSKEEFVPFVPFIGDGIKKKKRSERKGNPIRKKLSIQKHSIARPTFMKKPLNSLEIYLWMGYFKIKPFNGIHSRNEIPYFKDQGYYIVNLDDHTGEGTHWIAIIIKAHVIQYFDSYGVNAPEEVVKLSNKLVIPYIYNSSQLQSDDSVLCGYYCIYVIAELYKGSNYYDILRRFHIDTHKNENIITKYFM